MTRALTAILLVGVFLMTGCSQGQVVSNLETAIQAAELILPLIGPSSGLDAATQTQIVGYLRASSTCLDQASTILKDGSLAPAQQAAGIAAACSAAVAPTLPAGTPANVASLVGNLALALEKFLAPFVAQRATPAAAAVKLSPSNAARITAVQARTRRVQAAAR